MGNQSNKSEGLFEKSEKSAYSEMKDDVSKAMKCSLKTRITGWVLCFIIGWLLSILSSIVFLIKHDTTIFAIFYSLGQVINISGSCFLSGPTKQFKDMAKQTRWVLSLFYIGSLIATLVLAFVLPDNLKVLVLLTMVIQMIAYFLYTLSYVPFGRKILKKCCECILVD